MHYLVISVGQKPGSGFIAVWHKAPQKVMGQAVAWGDSLLQT